MHKSVLILVSLLVISTLVLTGCSGVSQDQYNQAVNSVNQLTQELNDTQAQLAQAQADLAQANANLAAAQADNIDISGTIWTGWESDGDYYEFYFMKNGVLHYKSPTGYWTVATWTQNGNSVYMEFNNKYAERQATINGNTMSGNAWNITGLTWTFTLERN
jgi:outer membrane murein-binding lipoprotein Lpp